MKMQNKIRIIGGSLRSRQIVVFDETSLRPTPNRIRETLFNWLQADIIDAHCLDLFAGSGALGFEALSRGAKSVTFIEKDHRILQNLKNNYLSLNITAAEFIQMDALSWLKQFSNETFDIIFLDPPYAENLLSPCLELLVKHQALAPHAKIYIEHNKPLSELILPEPLTLLKHKKAGQVYYGLVTL